MINTVRLWLSPAALQLSLTFRILRLAVLHLPTIPQPATTPRSTANLVTTQTLERLYHPPTNSYAQTERGVFLIRGENVVLLGEVVRSSTLLPLLLRLLLRSLTFVRRTDPPSLSTQQDLDLEDPPLQRMSLQPWNQIAALLDAERAAKAKAKKQGEKVLFERSGFGEEGGEGDAY